MNKKIRRSALWTSVLCVVLFTGLACQAVHENVVEYERESTVDGDTRAARLMTSGRQYLDSELYVQAEEAYREVTRLVPDNRVAFANLAYAIRAQERHEEAFDLYRRYTVLFADDPDGFARLAAIYDEKEDYTAAARNMVKAVELSPEDASLHAELAHFYRLTEDWELAQVEYEKALELDPENEMAQQYLPEVYKQLGKTDELLVAQEILLEKDPENVGLVASVARLRLDAENYAGAAELYGRLAELRPETIAPLKNMAIAQLRMDDTLAAVSTYKRVVDIDRNDSDVYILLADLLSSKAVNRVDEAITNLGRGLELNPENARGWCVWGDILEGKKEYESAIAKFEKAATMGDSHWSPYAQRQIPRQEQFIERERALKEQEKYEALEEL